MEDTAVQLAAKIAAGRNPDLARAYVAFWAQVQNVVRDARNPHLGNNYATLEATLAAIKPALAANKLALLSVPGVVREGNMSVTTMLLHESGQSWVFTTELPLGGKLDKKTNQVRSPDAQSAGSCITYARRYIAQAIAGIAPVDDDGEGASQAPTAVEMAHDDSLASLSAAIKGVNSGRGKTEAMAALDAIKAAVRAAGDTSLLAEYLSKRAELKALAK